MINYKLSFIESPSEIEINLNSSKSESNRLLIIKSLSDNKIELENLSHANDTVPVSYTHLTLPTTPYV